MGIEDFMRIRQSVPHRDGKEGSGMVDRGGSWEECLAVTWRKRLSQLMSN